MRTLIIAILLAIIVALVYDRIVSPPQPAGNEAPIAASTGSPERLSFDASKPPPPASRVAEAPPALVAKAAPPARPGAMPPPAGNLNAAISESRAALVATIDQRIKAILGPLPDVNPRRWRDQAPATPVTTAADIAMIRQNILQHYQWTGTGHPAALQSAHQLCDFLASSVTERDAFTRRLANTLASEETALANGSYRPSSWYAEYINQQNRQDDREARIAFFQSKIKQEWGVRAGQLQLLAGTKYAAFRATLPDPKFSR